jgi:hypothetical protein
MMTGYRFFVASNHFIIHLDHNGYFNWDGGWKRDFQLENKNAISFFDEGLQELEHFFGKSFRMPRCKYPFVSNQF